MSTQKPPTYTPPTGPLVWLSATLEIYRKAIEEWDASTTHHPQFKGSKLVRGGWSAPPSDDWRALVALVDALGKTNYSRPVRKIIVEFEGGPD